MRFKSLQSASKGGKGQVGIPFSDFVKWDIYKNNIVLLEGKNNFVQLMDMDGNPTERIPLPLKKQTVSDKDIEDWMLYMQSDFDTKKMIEQGHLDINYWKSRLPFPEYKPLSGSLFFVDQRSGYLYSLKYNGYAAGKNYWIRVNLDTGKVDSVPYPYDKIGLLVAIRKNDCLVMQEENDSTNMVKVKKKKIFPSGEK
ncbi:MAG: hypothetical protein GY765_36020 [bacterium]|nr:hypothetical protein [bacterium]